MYVWEHDDVENKIISIYDENFKNNLTSRRYKLSKEVYNYVNEHGDRPIKKKIIMPIKSILYKAQKKTYGLIDDRTINHNNMWHVWPIATNGYKVIIICPYCGQLHVHCAINGHRNSHCYGRNNESNTDGYIIMIDENDFN